MHSSAEFRGCNALQSTLEEHSRGMQHTGLECVLEVLVIPHNKSDGSLLTENRITCRTINQTCQDTSVVAHAKNELIRTMLILIL